MLARRSDIRYNRSILCGFLEKLYKTDEYAAEREWRIEMKRCIVCGNTEDNNNTVCNICGGSFVDIPGDTSSEEMVAETTMEEEETVEITE